MLKYSNNIGRKIDHLNKGSFLIESMRSTIVHNTLGIFYSDFANKSIYKDTKKLQFVLEHLWLCFGQNFEIYEYFEIMKKCLNIYNDIFNNTEMDELIQSNCLYHQLLLFDERSDKTANNEEKEKFKEHQLKIFSILIKIFMDISKLDISNKQVYLFSLIDTLLIILEISKQMQFYKKSNVINDVTVIIIYLFDKYPIILDKWNDFVCVVNSNLELKKNVVVALNTDQLEKTKINKFELIYEDSYANDDKQKQYDKHEIVMWKKQLNLLLLTNCGEEGELVPVKGESVFTPKKLKAKGTNNFLVDECTYILLYTHILIRQVEILITNHNLTVNDIKNIRNSRKAGWNQISSKRVSYDHIMYLIGRNLSDIEEFLLILKQQNENTRYSNDNSICNQYINLGINFLKILLKITKCCKGINKAIISKIKEYSSQKFIFHAILQNHSSILDNFFHFTINCNYNSSNQLDSLKGYIQSTKKTTDHHQDLRTTNQYMFLDFPKLLNTFPTAYQDNHQNINQLLFFSKASINAYYITLPLFFNLIKYPFYFKISDWNRILSERPELLISQLLLMKDLRIIHSEFEGNQMNIDYVDEQIDYNALSKLENEFGQNGFQFRYILEKNYALNLYEIFLLKCYEDVNHDFQKVIDLYIRKHNRDSHDKRDSMRSKTSFEPHLKIKRPIFHDLANLKKFFHNSFLLNFKNGKGACNNADIFELKNVCVNKDNSMTQSDFKCTFNDNEFFEGSVHYLPFYDKISALSENTESATLPIPENNITNHDEQDFQNFCSLFNNDNTDNTDNTPTKNLHQKDLKIDSTESLYKSCNNLKLKHDIINPIGNTFQPYAEPGDSDLEKYQKKMTQFELNKLLVYHYKILESESYLFNDIYVKILFIDKQFINNIKQLNIDHNQLDNFDDIYKRCFSDKISGNLEIRSFRYRINFSLLSNEDFLWIIKRNEEHMNGVDLKTEKISIKIFLYSLELDFDDIQSDDCILPFQESDSLDFGILVKPFENGDVLQIKLIQHRKNRICQVVLEKYFLPIILPNELLLIGLTLIVKQIHMEFMEYD